MTHTWGSPFRVGPSQCCERSAARGLEMEPNQGLCSSNSRLGQPQLYGERLGMMQTPSPHSEGLVKHKSLGRGAEEARHWRGSRQPPAWGESQCIQMSCTFWLYCNKETEK